MTKKKKNRGFALINKEKLTKISGKGGKTAHKLGRAHQFNSIEAQKAGRIGGQASLGRRLTEEHKKRISEGMKKVRNRLKTS